MTSDPHRGPLALTQLGHSQVGPCAVNFNPTMASIPVLLDTDIGSDIDDALAIAYLLGQPRCELLGITTVSGRDPRIRASLADAVCRAAGRTDIPIHSGCATRFDTGAIIQPEVPQAAILDRFPHRPPADFAQGTAIDFLRRTINNRPGEIVLLAIGPLTNLALLEALEPGILSKLRGLMLMCGHFTLSVPGYVPEWNARLDPLATQAVYRLHRLPLHRSVGCDITRRIQLPVAEALPRFRAAGGALGVVAACTEVWQDHAPVVVFHDPLAAACIFSPEFCTWQRGLVEVETLSPRLGGYTSFSAQAEGPHEVAISVDAPAFLQEYFAVAATAQPA